MWCAHNTSSSRSISSIRLRISSLGIRRSSFWSRSSSCSLIGINTRFASLSVGRIFVAISIDWWWSFSLLHYWSFTSSSLSSSCRSISVSENGDASIWLDIYSTRVRSSSLPPFSIRISTLCTNGVRCPMKNSILRWPMKNDRSADTDPCLSPKDLLRRITSLQSLQSFTKKQYPLHRPKVRTRTFDSLLLSSLSACCVRDEYLFPPGSFEIDVQWINFVVFIWFFDRERNKAHIHTHRLSEEKHLSLCSIAVKHLQCLDTSIIQIRTGQRAEIRRSWWPVSWLRVVSSDRDRIDTGGQIILTSTTACRWNHRAIVMNQRLSRS